MIDQHLQSFALLEFASNCCIVTTIYTNTQYIYIYICMQNTTIQWRRATMSLEKYTSHFIWKGCVREGVEDWTELQHIDPHSIGHNRVSFPFSSAIQPGAWGPTLLGAGFLYRILSPTGHSKLPDFLSSLSYIIVPHPPSCGRHKLHSFNPSIVKVIISWSTRCTCYLQRCISYFDSPAGS